MVPNKTVALDKRGPTFLYSGLVAQTVRILRGIGIFSLSFIDFHRLIVKLSTVRSKIKCSQNNVFHGKFTSCSRN